MAQFGYQVTKDRRVRVTFHGRHVVTVAGAKAERLTAALEEADAEQTELLLARATGNFKHGNERRVNG
jgi:S-adenosylmethionine hydrolase